MGEPGSSVSMVSGHGLDDRMIQVRSPAEAKGFFVCVQTSSGVHPDSCTMGTGVPFPGAKRGRGVTLTTHPHLVPRSWMSRSYTSSVPSPFAACSGTVLAFNYIGTDSSSIYRLCLYVCSVLKSEWLTYLSSHIYIDTHTHILFFATQTTGDLELLSMVCVNVSNLFCLLPCGIDVLWFVASWSNESATYFL
jgi:hypothetical protein